MVFFKLFRLRVPARIPPSQQPPLLSPDYGYRTLNVFPAGFHEYRYVGPAVECFRRDTTPHCHGLVARMVHEHRSASGAVSKEEMTASLQDLHDAQHPDLAVATHALTVYYASRVSPDRREKATTSTTGSKNDPRDTSAT